MKYIIISDIHGNRRALDAVMASFPKDDDIRVFCAGDIVGYGAEPGECLRAVREKAELIVMGNHDAAVSGTIDPINFNDAARAAVRWTCDMMDEGQKGFLAGLPFVLKEGEMTLVHGTLEDPGAFNYLMFSADAMRTFEAMETRLCFLGHSHIPGMFKYLDGKIYRIYGSSLELEREARYIVNVGSVGQPRDNDNRACYCVYDSDRPSVSLVRVEYDVRGARESIIEAGLPKNLGDRLVYGR